MFTTIFILSALAALPTAAGASGQAGAAAAGSDVFVCDFEDQYDQDYDGWPDGWKRRRGRQWPEFLKLGIVAETTSSTNRCLLLELDGGGAVVSSPAIPISPQFSLQLTFRLKTEGLVHDGAWAELMLLDAEGNSVEAHASPKLVATAGWQTVKIGPFSAAPQRAVKAVLSLHLEPLGKREDLRGKAWFDDLRMIRLPRMTLTPRGSPTGVYAGLESVELACEVSGICVPDPQVRFELYDNVGVRLAEHRARLTSRAAATSAAAAPEDGYAGQTSWSPPLPDFGFYRVRASLFAKDQEEVLLDRQQSLAILRPLAAPGKTEFGWSLASHERPYAFGQLPALLSQAAVGWVKLPVWYDESQSARFDRVVSLAEQLNIHGIELVGVLDQPPPSLREVFREPGKLAAATVFAERQLWEQAAAPMMTRLSLKVRWWQLGEDGDASFLGHPQLEGKIAEIKQCLGQYGQQIHLGFNWRWGYSPPRAGSERCPWAFLMYGSEPALTADEISAYVLAGESAESVAAKAQTSSAPRERRDVAVSSSKAQRSASLARFSSADRRVGAGSGDWLLLPPLPKAEYSMSTRATDLVRRMLAAKIQGAGAAFVPEPFSDEHGIMDADGSPGELLVPWRTTAALVGGATYLGPMQLPGGATGHVFARSGRAVAAIWSDRPATEYVNLGDEVEHIDIWGRLIRAGRGPDQPVVELEGRQWKALPVTPVPSFLTGLSEGAARWQVAVNFEGEQLSSVAGRRQSLVLKIPNTFSQSIAGELRLYAPKGWDVDARPTRFKLAEGEVLRLPLVVTLKANTNSGPQPLRLDFALANGQRFSVYRTLQLGLDDVQVEMTTRLRPDGALVVEQNLTNLSARPLSFQCLLFAPQRRREARQVINLGRDRTTLLFILPQGVELIGQDLWLRAEEIGGPRVLNFTLPAER